MYTYTRRARIILINIWGGGASKKILTFTSIYYMPPPLSPENKIGDRPTPLKFNLERCIKSICTYIHVSFNTIHCA